MSDKAVNTVVPHTIGTDPEFFLREKGTGKLKSAIPFIQGDKYNPMPLPCGGTIQRDNVAIEVATAPANSGSDFVDKVRKTFADLMTHIPEGHELVVTPYAEFDLDQLQHEEAQAFGCTPDFDVWTLDQNVAPYAGDTRMRSCGAHIHVGYTEGSGNGFLLEFPGRFKVVKMMDLFHGVISTVLDSSKAALERKKLYGRAGCHRITPYGIEYRVLSNFWMKSPSLVMLMDSLTVDVLRLIREGKDEDLINKVGPEVIISTINKGNIEKAMDIINSHLKGVMNQTSIDLFDQCMERMTEFDFNKEWNIMEAKA